LIVVARGLYRKLYRAWVMAMALIALGLLASLLKGLDWEESLSMGPTFQNTLPGRSVKMNSKTPRNKRQLFLYTTLF